MRDRENGTTPASEISTDVDTKENSKYSDIETDDDYSDSEKSDGDDGFETIEKAQILNEGKINYREYKYLISRNEDTIPTEQQIEETLVRRFKFLVGEIVNDMGIHKGNVFIWA